ncbi:MAG: pentapeptide repeat-containing protein [Coleofasciculaceae cyanobacterium]
MNVKHLAIIFLLALASSSCSEETQKMYKLEMERKCIGCDLRNVDLSGENLSGKYRIPASSSPLSIGPDNLRKAAPVNLTEADLSGANLSSTNLTAVILNHASLRDANLTEANLKEAQLEKANLTGASLKNADLQEANLKGANLKGADLSNANLSGADLTGATVDNSTRWKGTDLSEVVGSYQYSKQEQTQVKSELK